MENSEHIKIEDLKEGYLYRVTARNAQFGIWIGGEKKAFVLSRFKLGINFLDTEYHWDTGAPYGTVKPWEEIEETEFTTGEMIDAYIGQRPAKEILKYLNLVGFMRGKVEDYEEGEVVGHIPIWKDCRNKVYTETQAMGLRKSTLTLKDTEEDALASGKDEEGNFHEAFIGVAKVVIERRHS